MKDSTAGVESGVTAPSGSDARERAQRFVVRHEERLLAANREEPDGPDTDAYWRSENALVDVLAAVREETDAEHAFHHTRVNTLAEGVALKDAWMAARKRRAEAVAALDGEVG